MNLKAAKSVAADRSKHEKCTMLVVYDTYSMEPYWRSRWAVIPERSYANNTKRYEPKFYVSPKGYVTPVHHHIRQDGQGGSSFKGRKRDCPLCHPGKPWL